MASTTSAAAVVAQGKVARPKPKVSTLQTPVSASYPSEMRSPLPGTPAYLIKEDNVKTPITPPHAYLDFLKTMSPALMSPAPTGTSSHFTFCGKALGAGLRDTDDKTVRKVEAQPSLSRTSSTDSAATVMTLSTEASDGSEGSDDSLQSVQSSDQPEVKRERSASPPSFKSKKPVKDLDLSKTKTTLSGLKCKPQSPRIIIPPSPFPKPASARLNHRAGLPGSPLSPATACTPMSARSQHATRSASCLSATPWSASASFSPTESEGGSSKTSKKYVRQVVTRTVTYSATPLDPAPKGKRRKLEE